MRTMLLLSFALIVMSKLASAQIPQGRECFAILGETDPRPGSALMAFAANGKVVHLYFLRERAPFDTMPAGGAFTEGAKLMIDQGERPLSQGSDGVHFDNGHGANYVVVVNGNAMSGTIYNPQGRPFPIRGTCR